MRLSRRFPLWVISFALDLVLSPVAACAQVIPDPCGTAAIQSDGVSLQLFLKNGQTIFREGEIIALTVEYSSASDKKYYLNTRGYDRSGRLDGMEVFCIDPSGGDDPLSDYFNGAMGFIGGGLGGEQDLNNKAYPINLELNEWKSLPPGSYRLSIVSHRVTVPTDNDPYGMGTPSVPLRSNDVEFQVVKADPD